MKKTTLFRMISILSLFAGTVSVPAQNLYLHYDDGKVLYLGKDNVDSITFSNYDADSVYHEAIVSQVVHTGYEKIYIPISSIVSISSVVRNKSYSTCPDSNHPHMIDLGLPSGIKWACCNVGASSPEGYGGYYAWGETSEKAVYNFLTYRFCTGEDTDGDGIFDDYHRDSGLYGVWQNIGSDIAATSYDVAHVRWGGSWCMPSLEQIRELLGNTTKKWISVNGVYGLEFTGPNGGKVFLPAAGLRQGGSLYRDGNDGSYWSSNLNPDELSYYAYHLHMDFEHFYCITNSRLDGRNVRPVSCVIPVKITDFQQTGSNYEKDGYTHDGETYSFQYEVAVTVEIENQEGVDDWGYVYMDPYGKLTHISLKEYGSPYTDTRYTYYRNDRNSSLTLYGYVKYEGDDDYMYGRLEDYDVCCDKTSCPDENHPHMIDLGLPSGTKWACCNVGASSPEGYGGYYAWGETEEKDNYSEENYKFWTDKDGDGRDDMDEYEDLGDIAGTSYDVAHVKWGGSWCMPSSEKIKELLNNSTSKWVSIKGVYGREFTGPNGVSVFLPAAGSRWGYGYDKDETSRSEYRDGNYWSSTLSPHYFLGSRLDFTEEEAFWIDCGGGRYGGQSVRPISK